MSLDKLDEGHISLHSLNFKGEIIWEVDPPPTLFISQKWPNREGLIKSGRFNNGFYLKISFFIITVHKMLAIKGKAERLGLG